MKLRGAIIIGVILTFSSLMVISPAIAAPNENASDEAKNRVAQIPENAIELEPGLFFTGLSKNAEGKTIGGLLHVYYQKEFAKPPWAGPKDKGGSSSCFELIAKGFKWDSASSYSIDPSRNDLGDLSEAQVTTIILDSVAEWNSNANSNPFQNINSSGTVDGGTWDNDGDNEIFFADIDIEGVIAGVQLYGKWWGKPDSRFIAEQDLIFDDADFRWTNATNSSLNPLDTDVMDLENIAQHELGHSAGLTHPEDSCTDETMYRFASAWETKKRVLNEGDIAGIQELYGAP